MSAEQVERLREEWKSKQAQQDLQEENSLADLPGGTTDDAEVSADASEEAVALEEAEPTAKPGTDVPGVTDDTPQVRLSLRFIAVIRKSRYFTEPNDFTTGTKVAGNIHQQAEM
jgi:hypothetical protein